MQATSTNASDALLSEKATPRNQWIGNPAHSVRDAISQAAETMGGFVWHGGCFVVARIREQSRIRIVPVDEDA
jgi:hypothetical protein